MSGKNNTLTDRETILLNFSTCVRCGHFLATCLFLQRTTLDQVLADTDNTWLVFNWQPEIGEALVTLFDLNFSPDLDRLTGLCSTCQRRIVFEKHQKGASLRLEIQPGSQIEESSQPEYD